VVSAVVLAGAFLVLSLRVTREVASEGAVDTRRLFAYGLPFLPVSLSQFFAARTDVLLLAALLTDPSAPIGYYSLAVGIAELVFLFPNAVSTFFFPHVAGASREDSDSQVAVVSRLTLLLTGLFALALAPAATIAILVVIPAFAPALPSFYILLAAATATGPARVLVGYLAGLSRPGLSSTVSLSALVANVALGLLAIPSLGIIGAALAVLVSSVFSSVICAAIAVRLSGEPFAAFWVPRLADVRYVIRSGRTVADRVRGRGTPT
jgi:O-antigen/teichoic acid export membrane protein